MNTPRWDENVATPSIDCGNFGYIRKLIPREGTKTVNFAQPIGYNFLELEN